MGRHAIYKDGIIFLNDYFFIAKDNLGFPVNNDKYVVFAVGMVALRTTAIFINVGDSSPFYFSAFIKKFFG